jgi:hypothetical protein
MSRRILGLCANAGVGKDTAADYLVKRYGYVKMSMADEMKRFTKLIFGFSDQQLWGPSQFREAVDERFNEVDGDGYDRWCLAEHELWTRGPAWCRQLFNGDPCGLGWEALRGWFMAVWRQGEFGISPRVVLQTIGTEFGRTVDDTVWARSTVDTAQKVLSGPYRYTRESGLEKDEVGWGQWWQNPKGVVIPDCRFRNELDAVKAAGGAMVRLKRDIGRQAGQVGIKGHPSETEQLSIPDSDFTVVLDVPEGLENFYRQLDGMMHADFGVTNPYASETES